MKIKILKNLDARGRPKPSILKELNLSVQDAYDTIHGSKKCEICNDTSRFISYLKGYAQFCGKKCSQKHKWTDESKIKGVNKRKEFYQQHPEKLKERNKSVSRANKIIWSSDSELRRLQTIAHKKTKTQKRNQLNLDDVDLYYRLVYSYTNSNDLNMLENFDKRGISGDNVYHLDHKFSIYEGFKQNILPCYIGNINNLEMLLAYENNSKGKNCSITVDELCGGFKC